MSDTVKLNHCPKCSAPIPAGAPQGLCPKCILLGAATATETGIPATATSEIPSLERVAAAFPQLEILELIGRGGMGFVFKARQPRLDRLVALKLLPDKLARDPRFAERFNREGRVLAKLNHPNIVSVFDFGQTEHFYFLMMEFVDGVNLRQAMHAGRFSPGEALAIVPKICEALQYAHGQGILHRDIKPENILLDARGNVKIADFGIAKLVGEEKPDVSLTATGAALGTPHYMAPEQFEQPATVDHRADIYSLGVVFYEMLTGELPIGRFAAPSSKTPVGANVDEVVFRTLEKDRERRYQSAGEMQTQVEHLSGAGAGATQTAPPRLPGAEAVVARWSQKAVWAAVLTGISLPFPVLLFTLVYLRAGGAGGWEIILALGAISLPGLVGMILGWMALSDIRAHQGRLRGLPLAVFAALAWPLFFLAVGTVVAPWLMAQRSAAPGTSMPIAGMLMLLVPAGTITFAIWAVYAAARWGGNKPPSQRRGVLKWVFLGLVLAGVGVVVGPNLLSRESRVAPPEAASAASQTAPLEPANAAPWIRFTFTAVELREVRGVRWLAIDYVDDVHGECQKAFPWETTIPGLKAETRTSEFVKEEKDSPAVRHQRIEYRMPDSSPRDQLERFRDNLEKALKQKSFRLELGDDEEPLLLFELPGAEGGSLKARIKVVPPLKTVTPGPRQTPWEQAQASVERVRKQNEGTAAATAAPKPSAFEFRLVADAADAESPVDELPERHNDGSETRLRVLRTVMLDGSSVARAGIEFDPSGSRAIAVELASEGARQFGAITAANIGRRLAIVTHGTVVSAPIIRTAITGGELKISGSFSSAELGQLVAELNRKPAGLEFSLVIERSLPRALETPAICLDLDSGLFKTNHTFRTDQRATRDWLRTRGVDLLAVGAADPIPVIDAFELASIEAPANAWDSLLPQDVGWNWALMRVAAKQESQLAAMPGRSDTFLFRTRENGFGLLQILPSTKPALDVKIRYKLVLDAAAPPAIPASAQNHSFGRVVLRTLSFNESLQDGFLDLDTGRLLTPPKDIAALFKTAYGTRMEWERKSDPQAIKMQEWLRVSGANLMAWGGDHAERLEMRGGVALNPPWTGTNRAVFDQTDPNVVAKQAETLLKPLLTNSAIKIHLLQPGSDAEAGQRQDTFQFMTREGTIGVLQILNTEDNPPGVKIRYKLVQAETAEKP